MALLAWWVSRERHAPQVAGAGAGLTERVLGDLASYAGSLTWEASSEHGDLGGAAIQVWNVQDGPAAFDASHGKAVIESSAWRVVVNLGLVSEIVCERRFIHVPSPFVWLDVSFRKGPDKNGYPDKLFTVRFPDEREDDFRRLCDRHRLRKVGDFAAAR